MQTGAYIVSFRAADNGGPSRSATRGVAITVLPTNAPREAGMWSPTAGPYGGAVTAMFASGSNVLAGTNAGIFRSTNAGDAWTKAGEGALASASVSAFASIGSTIFAGTSAGVYRSTDNGATWAESNQGLPVGALASPPLVLAFAVKGPMLFASANGTVFVSSDNARSWSRADTGLPATSAVTALVTSGSSVFAAALFDGIYRTTDDGRNWTRVRRTERVEFISTLAANAGTIYAATSGGLLIGSPGLLASADNGQNWTQLQIEPPLVSTINSLAFTANLQLAGTAQALYNLRRVPNRMTFEAVPLLDKQYVISLAADGATIYAGTYNGVFRSTDAGATWRQINNGLSALVVSAFASAGSNIFAGTNNGVFASSDAGRSWQAANDGLTSSIFPYLNVTSLASVTASGSTQLFALQVLGEFYSSSDLGKSWRPVEGLPGFTFISSIGASGSTLFVGVSGRALPSPDPITVYRSTDLGKSWTPASRGMAPVVPSAFASIGANIFAIGGESVFVSSDNGESWTAANNGLPEKTRLTALTAGGSNLYVGTLDKGIYVSSNNGRNWSETNALLPPNAVIGRLFAAGTSLFAVVIDPSSLGSVGICVNGGISIDGRCFGSISPVGGFAGLGFGGGALYFSPNQGRSWGPIAAGLNEARVSAVGANGANVFAGTAGSGIFVRPF
jgi:photosystem II stability/assembly factor-like uncharacterized protein